MRISDLSSDVCSSDLLPLAEVAFLMTAADGVGHQIGRLGMAEVGAAEIGHGEFAEDVVDDRGRHLDGVVALNRTRRLEAGEGEGLDELLQGDAVLEAERECDGEVVDERWEGGG